jgi:catechol 2,3-dioxygenase-like lactoylglutathione lyase family enzyme
MRHLQTHVAAVLAALLLTPARGSAQAPAGTVRFDEFAPTTFSVVTLDARRLSNAWADVLGIPAPALIQPDVTYPPAFSGDRASRPTMATFQMANMALSMHQPPAGTYWKQILDAHGQLLYRMNFRVHGLADQTSHFERKGATLTIGDPAKVPYVNVNLWPTHGIALELNGVADNAPAPAPRPAPPAGSFARHPVSKIAFVVPNLEQAIRDYRELFGLPAPTTGTTSSLVFPKSAKADRTATLKWARFTFPNGVLLELNEPVGGPSVWRDHLTKHGRSIFSVGFRVGSVREEFAYLASKGGVAVFGGPAARYAGFDFVATLGAVIEIQE